jgi:hypothetical protein
MIDMRARSLPSPYAVEDKAWDSQIAGSTVYVSHGPICWGGALVDSAWATKTRMGGGADDIALPAVTGNRWLYVKADLGAGTVTAEFMADDSFPLDDVPGFVLRRPISLWKIATAGDPAVTTGFRLFIIPCPVPTEVAAVFGPRRAP